MPCMRRPPGFPLIIAGPDIVSDAAVDDLVSLVDLYPTFMDMAGLDHPSDLAGTSLSRSCTAGKRIVPNPSSANITAISPSRVSS